jgi:hypothetical protein
MISVTAERVVRLLPALIMSATRRGRSSPSSAR